MKIHQPLTPIGIPVNLPLLFCHLFKIFVLFSFSACSTPPYASHEGPTNQLEDNTVRYGSIAGLGAAGFFAGKALGGNNTTGALGAATGLATGYGLNKFFDGKRKDAYQTGYEDGGAATRAEILQEKWRREAIYGLTDSQTSPPLSHYREVYVPSREINGVKLEGEYQTVQLLK